jgi:cysteine desulfurase
LERLTSNRIYFDFNATSPLCESVQDWLTNGDFSVFNPSSEHTSGRSSRLRQLNSQALVTKILGLGKSHEIFWHSGATEGINSIVKSLAIDAKENKSPFHFFYFESDHAAVRAQVRFLEILGLKSHCLSIDKNCDFDINEVVERINKADGVKLLNFTWVNNETGVCWPLELALDIKKKTQCLIHVDAVQAIGKIENWNKLLTDLDFYSYSGHKFGALKGIGFTLLKKGTDFKGFIEGGSQQNGLRSGTENSMGIESVALALQYFSDNFSPNRLEQATRFFEEELKKIFQDKIKIIGEDAKHRNLNTIFAVFTDAKSDALVAAMDMAGFDVGKGSACSSGLSTPNKTLLAIGLDEALARNAVRFSFSPFYTLDLAKGHISTLKEIFLKFI